MLPNSQPSHLLDQIQILQIFFRASYNHTPPSHYLYIPAILYVHPILLHIHSVLLTGFRVILAHEVGLGEVEYLRIDQVPPWLSPSCREECSAVRVDSSKRSPGGLIVSNYEGEKPRLYIDSCILQRPTWLDTTTF